MSTRIKLPSAVNFLKQSEELLNLRFDFFDKKIIDTKTYLPVGDFNKIFTGGNKGKIFISPLALATIRQRIELLDDFSTTDKVIKDALVICYEEMLEEFRAFSASLPDWIKQREGV